MKTETYDFRAFCRGELHRIDKHHVIPTALSASIGAAVGVVSHPVSASATVVERAVPALAPSGHAVTVAAPVAIDHAFDPVIHMLQQIAFPVASIVLAWACLQAMVGKPAAAVDRAKWAVLGYLAMRYAPELLRHV